MNPSNNEVLEISRSRAIKSFDYDIEFNLPTLRSDNYRLCLPSKNNLYSCTPSIISPGVQKCGTSFAFQYLTHHPQIGKSKVKEVNYFIKDNYPKGIETYFAQLPNDNSKVSLDFSPKYMMLPESVELIYLANPTTRFIVLLRDPVDRAYSHFRFQQLLFHSHAEMVSKTPCPNRIEEVTFKQYLSEEFNVLDSCDMLGFDVSPPPWIKTDQISDNCKSWRCFDSSDIKSCSLCFNIPDVHVTSDLSVGYLSHGIYYSHILHYFNYFPRENFLFVRFEDLEDRGEVTVLNEMAEWIGVEAIDEKTWGVIKEVNSNDYPPMEPDEEEFLRKFFEGPNKQLYSLLGRDMGWKKPQ